MAIIRKVYKQGNSAVVSIPRYMWGEIGCDLGAQVEIEAYPGRMLTITYYKKGVMPAATEKTEGDNDKK